VKDDYLELNVNIFHKMICDIWGPFPRRNERQAGDKGDEEINKQTQKEKWKEITGQDNKYMSYK
jgi:hypothetical protein